jgi:restriction endonuclease S subunit
LFRERREKVSDKEWTALSVSKDGILPQLQTAVKTDNGDNRKKVCQGDFVVNSRSDRKGSCGFSNYDGSVSLINIVLKPINVVGQFYHYLFRSNDYIEEFYKNGRGIVADLWTTRYSEMRNIYIPVPPASEQRTIVGYLQDKTSKIDKLISEKTREMEYMKELRQRIISDAVTGKIDVRS